MAFSDTRAASEESALDGNPDEIARKIEKLRDMGVEDILLNGGGTSRDNLRRFAKEVMPAFRTEPEMRATGSNCHCEERSDAAIPIEVRTSMGIAASLRSSQ